MTTNTTEAPGWSLNLRGTTYQLVPALPALRGIERATGCTIFALVEAAADGGLTIDQMTSIAVCLAKVSEDEPLIGRAQIWALNANRPSGTGPGAMADGVAGAIVEEGVMAVMSRLLIPLVAVMSGRVDAKGNLRTIEA